MTTGLVSSTPVKIFALVVFAILVLWVCAFLVTTSKKNDGRHARGDRDVEKKKLDD